MNVTLFDVFARKVLLLNLNESQARLTFNREAHTVAGCIKAQAIITALSAITYSVGVYGISDALPVLGGVVATIGATGVLASQAFLLFARH